MRYDYDVRIKYKFSDFHDTFLIQYFPGKNIDNESFTEDLFKIQNELNEMFGDNAPLFSRGEELFQLTQAWEIKPLKKDEFFIMNGPYSYGEKMRLLNPSFFEKKESTVGVEKVVWDMVKKLRGKGL